ncbi:MAG: UDP-N-acetylglucosamine pyrophosphorylase, partial [Lachnospiraceae bacterium]|nr:UDP-N-acetylglucosamine pyrophosphorylase [Lachnospiraceae bacterium]
MADFSEMTIENMYDLSQTIAAELFEGKTYPWEVLPEIGDFIKKLGPTLDPEEYEKKGEDIWIAKSATVAPTASITGPCIIG